MMGYVYRMRKWFRDIRYKIHLIINGHDNESNEFLEVEKVEDILDKIEALLDFGLYYVDRNNTGADSNMYRRKYTELKDEYIDELKNNVNNLINKLNEVEKIDNYQMKL